MQVRAYFFNKKVYRRDGERKDCHFVSRERFGAGFVRERVNAIINKNDDNYE